MRLRHAMRLAAAFALGSTLSGCPSGMRLGPSGAVALGSQTTGAMSPGGFTEVSAPSTLSGAVAPAYAGPVPGTLAVYAEPTGPLVADRDGLFRFAGGTFSKVGPAFAEASPPAAIAQTASGSVLAAGQSGIYDLVGGAWSLAVSTQGLTDLAVSPDGTFGLAVQADGGTWSFDGRTWTRGPALPAPLGGVAIVSATESYVVGQALLDEWNGQAFSPIAQPDPANLVAGLTLAPEASGSVLLATTRAAIWQRAGATWTQTPGAASSSALALGIPSVQAGAGVVAEIGNASPSVFLFDGTTWRSAPSPSQPVDTVAIAGPQTALAMTADGSALLELSGGTWATVAAP